MANISPTFKSHWLSFGLHPLLREVSGSLAAKCSISLCWWGSCFLVLSRGAYIWFIIAFYFCFNQKQCWWEWIKTVKSQDVKPKQGAVRGYEAKGNCTCESFILCALHHLLIKHWVKPLEIQLVTCSYSNFSANYNMLSNVVYRCSFIVDDFLHTLQHKGFYRQLQETPTVLWNRTNLPSWLWEHHCGDIKQSCTTPKRILHKYPLPSKVLKGPCMQWSIVHLQLLALNNEKCQFRGYCRTSLSYLC